MWEWWLLLGRLLELPRFYLFLVTFSWVIKLLFCFVLFMRYDLVM